MLPLSPKSISVVVISVFVCTSVWADAENTELSRLLLELKSLERIIQVAEHSADKRKRNAFDYDQLRDDLKSIQQGIEDHVNTIPRDPRSLPDIKATY